MTSHKIEQFECRFKVEYILRRHRKVQSDYFKSTDESMILNRPASSDVRKAFRIVDRHMISNRLFSDDILLWDDRLFWPLRWKFGLAERVTENELLEEIAYLEEDIFDQHPSRRVVEPCLPRMTDLIFRSVVSNDFKRSVAECLRKAESYLMFLDGRAYVAGGEPVYVVSEFGMHFVRAVGPDRAADPDRQWIKCNLDGGGVCDNDLLKPVYRADQFEQVIKSVTREYRSRIPTIEVLDDCPAVTAEPAEILCDSLYRRLVHDARTNAKGSLYPSEVRLSDQDPRGKEFLERVLVSAEGPLSGSHLTVQRTALLQESLGFEGVTGILRAGIQEYLRMEGVADLCATLDPRDDEALSSLA
jgi:hypothetical protein